MPLNGFILNLCFKTTKFPVAEKKTNKTL